MPPWQVRLYSRSLMKKEKVRLIRRSIDFSGLRVFDLGSAQGSVSYQLKRAGGQWIHADLDSANLLAALPLLGGSVVRVGERNLPCRDDSFDLVLLLDFLEHVRDDRSILAECRRLLRSGGRIVVSTPIAGDRLLLNRLKKRVGLHPEIYGHKRAGYSLEGLSALLAEEGFVVEQARTYAKFFVELFEVLLNWRYAKFAGAGKALLRTGGIAPQSAADFGRHRFLFWVYSYLVYPLVYLVTRLDRLLFWKTGYATLAIGRKK